MNHSSVDYDYAWSDKLQELEEAIAEQLQPRVQLWWIRSGVPGESRRWPDWDSEPPVWLWLGTSLGTVNSSCDNCNTRVTPGWQVTTKYYRYGDSRHLDQQFQQLSLKLSMIVPKACGNDQGYEVCVIFTSKASIQFHTFPCLTNSSYAGSVIISFTNLNMLALRFCIPLTSDSFRCSTRIRTWTNRRQ